MILDGNTDWDPDDVDEAIDPGATVGIGPLPQRGPAGRAGSSGSSFDDDDGTIDPARSSDAAGPVDSRPAFGPFAASAGIDRPPMVTDRLPASVEQETAPHGWIATGPLPFGHAATAPGATDPLPTGPVPVTPVAAAGSGVPARVLGQAAAVVLAAGLVGSVVYGVLRSAAGDSGSSEQAEVDRTDELAVDPGPGDASGGLIGSKRAASEFDGSSGDSGAASFADDDTADAEGTDLDGTDAKTDAADDPKGNEGATVADAAAPPEAGGSGPPDGDPSAGPTPDDGPAGPATIPGQPSSTVTANDPPIGDPTARSTTSLTSRSTTTNSFDRTSTTRRVTTQPSTVSTIGRSTTTRRTTTTGGSTSTSRLTSTTRPTTTTSTTRASTTTTLAPQPVDLIAAPILASQTWELGLFLRANEIDGADSYCWVLIGSGGELTQCQADTNYRLPANRTIPGPGPVTIRAEARSADGSTLASEQIGVQLLSRGFISSPRALAGRRLDQTLRLVATEPPAASRYCWTLIQGSTSSGQLCSSERTLELAAGTPALSGFEPGLVRLQATAEQGGVIVGRQEALFRFLDS